MPTQQVDQSSQLDQFGLETVGGTSSSQFAGQTTAIGRPNAVYMASNGQILTNLVEGSTGIAYSATTGSELTVVTYTLPAKTLDVSGRGIVITAWGSATFASGTCVVKMYFGSVGTSVGTLATTNPWWGQINIWKASSNKQTGYIQSTISTTHQGSTILNQTETDTSTITIKITANNSAVANAAVINGFTIEGLN